MKIFLIGSNSPAGHAFIRAAERRDHELFQFPRADQQATHDVLDLRDHDALQQRCFKHWPDVIINCLETRNTTNKKELIALNVDLPKFLAQISHHLNTRLIHLSSNKLFDGLKGRLYRFSDKPNSTELFGHSKHQAEEAILKHNPDTCIILRIPDLLGTSGAGGELSFNEAILESVKSNRKIQLSDSLIEQPTTSFNMAEILLELSERPDLNGLFNWSGCQAISQYALAQKVLENAGIEPTEAHLELLEPRSETIIDLSMELQPLKRKVKTKALNLKEVFEELNFIEPLKFS